MRGARKLVTATAASAIEWVGVVGAGQMGSGIAQVAAVSGFPVNLCDASEAALAKGHETIKRSFERLMRKGAIDSHGVDQAMERITLQKALRDLAADAPPGAIVIEAVTESEPLKAKILRELDDSLPPGAILASNTSSISITRLAAATARPDKVIGMHFMNPVPLMNLVEIIRGMATDDSTFQAVSGLATAMGKQVCCSLDYPGFIVNRILMPMINEAFFALMEGVASAEDIDLGMRLGTNQPMGPLTLADFIGLDTCLAIMRVLHEGLGDSKYRPCPLLVQYVDAGWLGRKTKRGVYAYD